ncbi:MAG: M61 family peptidase, partial [Colwellia sp.]|nr:M61 family peptidase [Colwellia sp.]
MTKISRFILPLLSIVASFFVSSLAIAESRVSVAISIEEPQHHYAKITLTYDNYAEQKAVFQLPTWRTGRYEIINLANGIRDFSAVDGKGNKLPWEKVNKDSWQVSDTLHKQVIISYQ